MSTPSARLFTNVAVHKQGKSACTVPSTATKTTPGLNQPSVYPLVKKARVDKLIAQHDADVVQFFCVGNSAIQGKPP